MLGRIGLIGGMSWESTAVYYREINELVRNRLGGLWSADVIMHSVNFHEIVALQKAGNWDAAAERLGESAQMLEAAGADCILICTNTMHLIADKVAARLSVPLINIIDETGAALKAAGARKPLLLATSYTMEHGFYAGRMKKSTGIDIITPSAEDRPFVHDVIFNELCRGIVKPESRAAYAAVIAKAAEKGADSVILGCTEIGLLIEEKDSVLPMFDSTLIHARSAVDFALQSLRVAAE